MFTRLWLGFFNRLEDLFGEQTYQKGKGFSMWGFLTVIAFVFAYIYSFDRVERLKSMQELVRLRKLLLESFFNR